VSWAGGLQRRVIIAWYGRITTALPPGDLDWGFADGRPGWTCLLVQL